MAFVVEKLTKLPPPPEPPDPEGGEIVDGGVFEPDPPVLLVLLDVSEVFVAVPFDVKAPDKIITLWSVAAFKSLLNFDVSFKSTVEDF